MKKITYAALLFIFGITTNAQVGIGTNTPDNSAMLEIQSNDKGMLFPRMTSAQRTGIVSPASGLHVFDSSTNSLWFYNGLNWINYAAQSKYGDIKTGIQNTDHEGWILLNGRALNTMSTTQQTVASSLGLVGNLPDATNTYLSQNGSPLASISGSNTTTLTQANLPSVVFTGTAASAGGHNHGGTSGSNGGHNHTGTTSTNGNHNHTGATDGAGSHSHSLSRRGNEDNGAFDPGNARAGESSAATTDRNFQGSFSTSAVGNHTHTFTTNNTGDHNHSFTTSAVADHSHSISVDGAHTHSVSVSSGGSNTPLTITPRTLSVNMFIYLGL